MLRSLAFAASLLVLPLAAQAAAIVDTAKGDVRAGSSREVMFSARENQRLPAGTTVTTGPDSQVVLKFDDGQRVVLHQNTEFRIVDFRVDERAPANGRAVFDFLKGALRVVTGTIVRRNPGGFALRAPQATIGVRGTDFMAAIVNPLYVSVTQGSVALTNAPGAAVFGAGSTASVANSASLAVGIPASSLPPAAAGAFIELGAMTITSGVGGPAVGAEAAATGAAAPTAIAPAALTIGAAAAAAAAASAAEDNEATVKH